MVIATFPKLFKAEKEKIRHSVVAWLCFLSSWFHLMELHLGGTPLGRPLLLALTPQRGQAEPSCWLGRATELTECKSLTASEVAKAVKEI